MHMLPACTRHAGTGTRQLLGLCRSVKKHLKGLQLCTVQPLCNYWINKECTQQRHRKIDERTVRLGRVQCTFLIINLKKIPKGRRETNIYMYKNMIKLKITLISSVPLRSDRRIMFSQLLVTFHKD